MRTFRNYTTVPDATVRAIYAAVCPAGLPAHDVSIKNHTRHGRGMAYGKGSSYHGSARPFVIVSLPKTERLARHYWHQTTGNGYLPVAIGSRLESLVYILAHELRHLWQAKAAGKPRGMVYGAKGRYSERDACAYGMQMLRRYRRGELL